jgi:hypothetical protein
MAWMGRAGAEDGKAAKKTNTEWKNVSFPALPDRVYRSNGVSYGDTVRGLVRGMEYRTSYGMVDQRSGMSVRSTYINSNVR